MGAYALSTLILVLLCISLKPVLSSLTELALCHSDFTLKPADGVVKIHTFKWLGFVQYIHTTTGLPHHSKAPRVVLVHKQFVLSTATDLMHLPKNYKLGQVIFGDYEQEESECNLSKQQLKMGIRCPRAYLEMPYANILPHPEFSRFGVGNSLALVKLLRPLKSGYMVPICLPTLAERERKKKTKLVFMVDYLSAVPRDFDSEKMAKKTMRLYTHKECRKHRMQSRLGSEGVTHVLCSSGCGVRSGAPIASRAPDGAFQLIGLAAGGGACTRRNMRKRLNKEPPLYIDVYPYVTWITNVITAHQLPGPYNNMQLTSSDPASATPKGEKVNIYMRKNRGRDNQRSDWSARTFVSGELCFESQKKQRHAAFFYSEKFEVNADPPGRMNVRIEVSASIFVRVVCARLLVPNRFYRPIIRGVGGYNISVYFETDWFPLTYYFALGLDGKNASTAELYEWFDERKQTHSGLNYRDPRVPGLLSSWWW